MAIRDSFYDHKIMKKLEKTEAQLPCGHQMKTPWFIYIDASYFYFFSLLLSSSSLFLYVTE